MINAIQLRMNIIRPVLEHLDPHIPYSLAAENLLMGTCAQESNLGSYIVQINGPARGIFQMEPATHDDIYKNYLQYRHDLRELIVDMGSFKMYKLMDDNGDYDDAQDSLTGNLYYAAAMCRVHYYRVPMAMPPADNVHQLANYWKMFYNTPEGKGTESEFIHNYNRYVA